MTQPSGPSGRDEVAALGAAPVVAHVFLDGHKGEWFAAESCEVVDGLISASGRWGRKTGVEYADTRFGPYVRRTWPVSRLREIRWLVAEEAQ